MAEPLRYQHGFGNALASEAVPGALPRDQNTPDRAPFDLFAEQINGTPFGSPRSQSRRSWLYRLRPAVQAATFEPMQAPPPHYGIACEDAVASPQVMRFAPLPWPRSPTDWLDAVTSFAVGGAVEHGRGLHIHLFAANADMQRVFCNADGDLLIAPSHGSLRVRTELGWLEVGPAELLVLPRGLRFAVFLPEARCRGFVVELHEGGFELPQRGLLGANGLADERHFQAPVADYESQRVQTELVVRHGRRFWSCALAWSPFDVVAWHGTYAPFKYDLRRFVPYGATRFDHPDPSIHTVLTCPHPGGGAVVDVGAFVPRWDPTEHTFRPPYDHRNRSTEFNAVVMSPTDDGPYPAGAYSWTPHLSPHGVGAAARRSASRAGDQPSRGDDRSVWLQFESIYPMSVARSWLSHPARDATFTSQFDDWSVGELTEP